MRVIIYLQELLLREACRPTCFLPRYKSIEKYTRVKSTVRECDHRARFTAAESSKWYSYPTPTWG